MPTTWDALPRIALASTLCSTAIVEFTIPQVVRLSRTASAGGLPTLRLFPHRAALMARMLPVQSLITITQFCAVREMHGAIDHVLGETPLNLPLSYGLVSVPLIAAKYNLVVEGVYQHHGATAATPAGGDRPHGCRPSFSLRAALQGSMSLEMPSGVFHSVLRITTASFLVKGSGSEKLVDVEILQASSTESVREFVLQNVRSLTLQQSAKVAVLQDLSIDELDTVVLGESSEISAGETITFNVVDEIKMETLSTITGRRMSFNSTTMFLQSSAQIHVDGRGHPGSASSEPGFGCGQTASGYNRARYGPSHGGKGGTGSGTCTSSQTTHGDKNAPTTMGGGANGGGKGGGVIRVQVSNLLTMESSSRISANGENHGSWAGGAGGSVWITTEKANLATDASITAIGGNGGHTYHGQHGYNRHYNSAGGGGGRILIELGASIWGIVGGLFAPVISVSGGDKGSIHTGASNGDGGSFVLRGTGTNPLAEVHFRPENLMRMMTSFEIFRVRRFVHLARSSLTMLASVSIDGLVEHELYTEAEFFATDRLTLSNISRFKTLMNAEIKSKHVSIEANISQIGGGTAIHADSWHRGTVRFVAKNKLTVEAICDL
jgi:hypothetical protein